MTTEAKGGRSTPTAAPKRGLLRLRRSDGPGAPPAEGETPVHRHAKEEPERPRVRMRTVVLHVILSAALWITYLQYWRVVLKRGVGFEILISVGVLILFGLSTYGGTLLWVAHNRRLARRVEGRRTGRPPAGNPLLEDFLGRRLQIPPGDAIRLAPRVVIRVEGNDKHFRPEGPVRNEAEVEQEPVC